MRTKQIFTVGYEGAELADFVSTLAVCGITQVLDVRDVPASRKPGFSKSPLREALEAEGISYVHLKALGDPKAGREAARSGDFEKFRAIFSARVSEPDAQTALELAGKLAGARVSCLLCFERDNAMCHRTIVANLLAKRFGFAVKHIGIRRGIASCRTQFGRYNERAREYAVG